MVRLASDPGRIHTFVFTDIEGSTRLWVEHPDTAPVAFALHDRILAAAFERWGGRVVKNLGDGLLAAFTDPEAAIQAAADAQAALAVRAGDLGGAASVRMAIHSGPAEERDDDLLGLEVNRCQRIMSAAHGGQVLVSAGTARAVGGPPPSPLTLIDLGRYRLKGLDEPEQLHQLAGPDLRRDFPPLEAPTLAPLNLPAESSSFVGRVQEIEEIDKLIRGSRLVTLGGEGGVGKTRLALKVASRLQGWFPDGIWAVELAAVTADSLVARQVSSSLGILPTGDIPPVEAVVSHLAPLTALLVLDNCEHVLPGVAEITATLLARGPHVKLVATSRERLGIPGESVYRVPSMPSPGPDIDPVTARRFDSVRLFAERAELVAPGFRLTDRNVGAVAAVCRRLDGIPLAIELAAAKCAVLTPEQIADGLLQRLSLLDHGRSEGGRHATLRAATAWSYELLEPAGRLLFTRLSVFQGGFDAVAAAGITGDDLAASLAGLSSLAEKSLIRRETDSERFMMLEPLRVFAAGWLDESGTSDQTRLAHAHYYAELAERAYAARQGTDLGRWLDRLDHDHANLLTGFDWAMKSGHHDLALSIAVGTSVLWKQRGHAAEGCRRLERALADEAGSDEVRARAHLAAGDLAADLGDAAGARRHLQEAHRLARMLGDIRGSAWALTRLASIAHKEGDLSLAVELFEAAVESGRPAGDDLLLGHVLASLALLVADRGAVGRARELAAEAVERSRATGNPYVIADALLTDGEIALDHGDAGAGRRRAEEALELGRREGMGDVTAWALAYLGRAALLAGDVRAGRIVLEKAIEQFEAAGTPIGRPWALRHLALAHWWSGEDPAAEAILREALVDAVAYVRPEVPLVLEVFGWVLAARSPETAARLLGCADAQRRMIGLSLAPFEAGHDDDARRMLTSALPAGELERLLGAGAALTPVEAVRLVSES